MTQPFGFVPPVAIPAIGGAANAIIPTAGLLGGVAAGARAGSILGPKGALVGGLLGGIFFPLFFPQPTNPGTLPEPEPQPVPGLDPGLNPPSQPEPLPQPTPDGSYPYGPKPGDPLGTVYTWAITWTKYQKSNDRLWCPGVSNGIVATGQEKYFAPKTRSIRGNALELITSNVVCTNICSPGIDTKGFYDAIRVKTEIDEKQLEEGYGGVWVDNAYAEGFWQKTEITILSVTRDDEPLPVPQPEVDPKPRPNPIPLIPLPAPEPEPSPVPLPEPEPEVDPLEVPNPGNPTAPPITIPRVPPATPQQPDRTSPRVVPVPSPNGPVVVPSPSTPVIPVPSPVIEPGRVPLPTPIPGIPTIPEPSPEPNPQPAPGPEPQPAPGPVPLPQPQPVPEPGTDPEPQPGITPLPGPLPVPTPTLPGIAPAPSPITGTQPDGNLAPLPSPSPSITPPGHHFPVSGGPAITPGGTRGDLANIAAEVGRIEQKSGSVMNQTGNILDSLGDLADILELLNFIKDLFEQPLPEKDYAISPVCTPDLPMTVVTMPEEKWADRLISSIDLMPQLLQAHLRYKTPTCSTRPLLEGDFRTINFISDEPTGNHGDRIRKRFRYRSTFGSSLGPLVEHWKNFVWAAGPVCVQHAGSSWGTPQVWAASSDEGKRVIRHAAAEAGFDADKDGRWVISGSLSSRIGLPGTMRVNTAGGYYWITARDGSDARPIVKRV